jgi:hypothetical protein
MRLLSKGQMLLIEDGFPRELILSEEERRAARMRTPVHQREDEPLRAFDPWRKKITTKKSWRRINQMKDRAAAKAGMQWCTRTSRWLPHA